MLLKNGVKRALPGRHVWPDPIDDSSTSVKFSLDPVVMLWPRNVPKPRVGLVPDVDVYPYWTKYRRFLEVNAIPFELYDIHRSDWRQKATDLDFIVWRPMGFPYELEECRRKFWILERYLGKLCYPTFSEALIYEDKILQYELLDQLGFPVVPTFVSHCETEALAHAASGSYPAVWKIACGSGSFGVELIKDRRSAERYIRQVFSFAGRRTYWPFAAQKNEIYVQPLLPNAGYDLRILAIGNSIMGYYRTPPRGEFRASGMHAFHFAPLPVEAMDLARRVRDALGLTVVALDVLADPTERHFSIIEISMFIQIDEYFELEIDGTPGTYVFEDGEYRFVPRTVAPQDLMLEELFAARWVAPRLASDPPE